MMKKERLDKKGYWDNELNSLWFTAKRSNEVNDKDEISALADNIKQVYCQEYKTAYDENVNTDNPKFDRII